MPDPTPPLRPAVFHILLALAGGSLHGLAIAQAVETETQGAVRLGPGTLYRSLKEMAHGGLIDEVTAPPERQDPRRRFYALSELGREVVRAEALRMADIVDLARANRVLPESR